MSFRSADEGELEGSVPLRVLSACYCGSLPGLSEAVKGSQASLVELRLEGSRPLPADLPEAIALCVALQVLVLSGTLVGDDFLSRCHLSALVHLSEVHVGLCDLQGEEWAKNLCVERLDVGSNPGLADPAGLVQRCTSECSPSVSLPSVLFSEEESRLPAEWQEREEVDVTGGEWSTGELMRCMTRLAEHAPRLLVLRIDGAKVADQDLISAREPLALLLGRLSRLSLCDNPLGPQAVPLLLDLLDQTACHRQADSSFSLLLFGCGLPPDQLAELQARVLAFSQPLSLSTGTSFFSSAAAPVRRSSPARSGLVPRPKTVVQLAAKWAVGGDPQVLKASLLEAKDETLRLQSLYDALLQEHAEVCLAYDDAVHKTKPLGLLLPDLHTVKSRARRDDSPMKLKP